jgi:hypothetical protein
MHESVMVERKQLTTNKFSPAVIVGCTDVPNFGDVGALNFPFLIPIYQRLYSWEPEHVKRLLDDLYGAFGYSPMNEYFIGAIVTTLEHQKSRDVLELIDGQQRLTTLWLIASVLVTKTELLETKRSQWHSFLSFTDQPQEPRLNFSGREADIKALKGFVSAIDQHSADNQLWLKNEAMANARHTINAFFTELESSLLQAFSDYLWTKATFVITQLHPETDKERFFDTMNSRGVQLEKHEILKALMLTGLSEEQRAAYGKAWDLCADIDGYIQGGLQSSLLYGLAPLDEEKIMMLSASKTANSSINIDPEGATSELSLKAILSPTFEIVSVDDQAKTKLQNYRSPVSFPVFLLHVLKIYVETSSAEFIKRISDKSISLDDKKLVEVFKRFFKNSEHEDRQEFIECLLECRLLLDNFVIKGELNSTSEPASWKISSRLGDTKKQTRLKWTGEIWASISMLQTMMHFSPMNGTQRVTWLTPVLKALISQRNNYSKSESWASNYLQALRQYDLTYAQSILGGKDINEVIGAGNVKGLGTGVHHYWFYKLEYCLWELWYNQSKGSMKTICEKPNTLSTATFRMRSINSIEHVSPQSQNNGEIEKVKLDRFGNLALISISENSSYSDKDPIEKKGTFNGRIKKGLIQSLKLAHIFSTFDTRAQDWDNTTMMNHECAMVSVLQDFHPELMSKNNTDVEAQE